MTDRSDVLRRYQRRVRAFSRIRRGIGNAMLAYRSGAVIAATVAFLLVYTGLPLQAPLVDAALFALALLAAPGCDNCKGGGDTPVAAKDKAAPAAARPRRTG